MEQWPTKYLSTICMHLCNEDSILVSRHVKVKDLTYVLTLAACRLCTLCCNFSTCNDPEKNLKKNHKIKGHTRTTKTNLRALLMEGSRQKTPDSGLKSDFIQK